MSRARSHPPPAGDAGPGAPIAPLIPPDRPRPRPAVLGVAALAPQQPATPDHETPLLDVALRMPKTSSVQLRLHDRTRGGGRRDDRFGGGADV